MSRPKPFREVRRLLEQHGWWLERIRGSHHVFKHERLPMISIPVHNNQVKAVYVKQVENLIGQTKGEED